MILKGIFDYDVKNKRLKVIDSILETPKIWENINLNKILQTEKKLLKDNLFDINQTILLLEEVNILLEMLSREYEKDILTEIYKYLKNLSIQISKIETKSMFLKKNDKFNCYLDIQPGSGGIESQDWALILLKMYLKWSELHNFKVEIIEESYGEIAGIKSATIKLIGDYAYGWLRTESGIHRLVRKSPFDTNKRRHTSFSSVFCYPDINNCVNIKINTSDLRIDVYRSSGAGGQHVNKTESAVRITHLPTKITTQCQNSRSQHKNKKQAMTQLKLKLYELELKKKYMEKKSLENIKSSICWGNQIRSYILDDSRIKDLRTGIETRDVQSVLNGHLDLFIKNSIKLGL